MSVRTVNFSHTGRPGQQGDGLLRICSQMLLGKLVSGATPEVWAALSPGVCEEKRKVAPVHAALGRAARGGESRGSSPLAKVNIKGC